MIKGKNTLSAHVVDSEKKTVTNAAVEAKYYMPPMSGMAPMEFNAAAVQKGRGYTFTADIPMEGAWKIDIMVLQPDNAMFTATFNIDARQDSAQSRCNRKKVKHTAEGVVQRAGIAGTGFKDGKRKLTF